MPEGINPNPLSEDEARYVADQIHGDVDKLSELNQERGKARLQHIRAELDEDKETGGAFHRETGAGEDTLQPRKLSEIDTDIEERRTIIDGRSELAEEEYDRNQNA